MLVYTDGACKNNGRSDAEAGWAFIFAPGNETNPNFGHVEARLELKGPTGIEYIQTSNRAELRAVCAALETRSWPGEGWERIVIATDSDYVVAGITSHIRKWVNNGWLNAQRKPVANRDLWERLLERIREFSELGLSLWRDEPRRRGKGFHVQFWQIPRQSNSRADALAKDAANMDEGEDSYPQHLSLLALG